MKRVFWLLLSLAACCEAAFAQTQSIDELRRIFDYDQKAPIDVRQVGVIKRNRISIHDITYASPKAGRVTAYLVVPATKGRFAGVVFGHWGYGTRTEFLPEAVLYAKVGVVSLLVDDLGVRPAPWRRNAPGSEPEAVRNNFIQSVVDLRRGIDLLRARSDVDPNRIAYVGHSSFITNSMDEFSDLDLVIAVEPSHQAAVMAERMKVAASLGELLAAFTGEHLGEPRVLICLYEAPLLHVDLKFVSLDDIATLRPN